MNAPQRMGDGEIGEWLQQFLPRDRAEEYARLLKDEGAQSVADVAAAGSGLDSVQHLAALGVQKFFDRNKIWNAILKIRQAEASASRMSQLRIRALDHSRLKDSEEPA